MAAHISLIGGRRVFLLSQGSLGVEVFIFISGFLMTLILKDMSRISWSGLRQFYLRRFFRIAPAFYVALLLYVSFHSFFSAGLVGAETFFNTPYPITNLAGPLGWRPIVLNVLFLHGLWPSEATKIFGPAWSLSLEMQFYLVAPFVVCLFRRAPFRTLVLLLATNWIGNRLFGIYGHTGWIANFTYPSFLPNRIFLFILGGSYCIYVFDRRPQDLIICLLTIAGIFPLMGLKSSLVCVAFTAIVHLAISSERRWREAWTAVAECKLTHLIAEWSYGIYLIHIFCMALAGHWLLHTGPGFPRLLVFAIYAAVVVTLSVTIAALLHTFVERPARDFGKRFSKRQQPRVEMADTLASSTGHVR